MISKMTDSIKTDPALDVSEQKNTLQFKADELERITLEDLNAIEMEGMPEPKEGELTAVEMSVVAAAQCYATTLHLQAYNEGILLNEVMITFTTKFDRAPFLSIREGNTGMYDPVIEV